ncbi:ABC transporter substrate-binding protein [Ureibacillus massiliensis 4400831 = CIP 108448 = CCUG 49529]|uniref:ABC transporter substrate-binding protein n=1 Tax=Ureibacillus massiliensis 4400831 = CIP 108448 = CCUG 49529 TaxID=1211035 RepID=A0A0A3J1J6_9BACL|nr:transporter substrate-binding domain-containing protein [Ureibacillus massiliensis]KGR89595.1 ABC transporter substrate-binding protein [Ureibacillus massiliensis 4400831 = CIP 108448 = CCUG 49529]
MKKKLTLMLSTLFAIFILAACGGANESTDSTSDTEQKDVFKVGLEAAYPPFNWTQKDDSNGAVKIEGSNEYAGGYDVEIAKRVADALGKELVIVKTDWDGLLPALDTKVIDAIIAGMSPTDKRKEAIDFSDNYYKSEFVIVTKADSKYANAKSLEEFAGAKVTSQLGTTNYDVIDQIPNVAKQTAMNNFTEMRVALETGVIDAYVAEKPEAISSTSANSNFVMVELGDSFEVNEADISVAVGLRKGDENLEKINEAIAAISEEERQELMKAAIENQPAAQ